MNVQQYPPAPDYRAYAAAGASALQRWYRPSRGLWQGAGWWQSANALTAVVRYAQATGDPAGPAVAQTTFRRAPRWRRGFCNKFFDDNAWWALAWVAAHDLTGEGRYLHAAERIFARNVAGWDGTCGGGLWWNTDRRYKNAITNELFLTLAARLKPAEPRIRPGGTGVGVAGLGLVLLRRPDRPGRAGQRRAHGRLPEQRPHHLDLQPGRDPRRPGGPAPDHRGTRATWTRAGPSRTPRWPR